MASDEIEIFRLALSAANVLLPCHWCFNPRTRRVTNTRVVHTPRVRVTLNSLRLKPSWQGTRLKSLDSSLAIGVFLKGSLWDNQRRG